MLCVTLTNLNASHDDKQQSRREAPSAVGWEQTHEQTWDGHQGSGHDQRSFAPTTGFFRRVPHPPKEDTPERAHHKRSTVCPKGGKQRGVGAWVVCWEVGGSDVLCQIPVDLKIVHLEEDNRAVVTAPCVDENYRQQWTYSRIVMCLLQHKLLKTMD